MTHSPIRNKPRFDEVEHKLYNRISSRLSSARQNRDRSKSAEEIRRIRSPVRTKEGKSDIGPRSQHLREDTSRTRAEDSHSRRDRHRSRSPRSPVRRERNASGKSHEKHPARRRSRQSPNSPKRRHRERSAASGGSPNRGNGHPGKDEKWDWSNGDKEKIAEVEAVKEIETLKKPNFSLSGKLAEDTNTYKGVVIKYNEPAEARMPKKRWRLYPFKGDESLPTLYIHRQSAYLVGRDRAVTDFPVHHPSCSKQHAVLQYRLVDSEAPNGRKCRLIKLYIIDLNSTNGTYVNNKRIEPQRYIELKATDMLRFGFSTREYILLNEDTNEEELSQGSDKDNAVDSESEN